MRETARVARRVDWGDERPSPPLLFERSGLARLSLGRVSHSPTPQDLARYLIGGVDAAEKGTPLAETYEAMNPLQKKLLVGLQNFVLTVPVGANTQVFLAADEHLDTNGGTYFENMKPAKANGATNDAAVAAKLWAASERLTGTTIDI